MQALIEEGWRRRAVRRVLRMHDIGEGVALVQRIIVLEGGKIRLDRRLDLPRRRRRGDARFAALKKRVLATPDEPATRPGAGSSEPQMRSMMMAGAMPPAAHIVTSPRRSSRRSNSSRIVPMRMEPVAPIG